jgi:CRISPR-associated protein Cmr4
MYERSMLMFLYASTPVHFGAGVSLGAVDLAIQRERHTGYPMAQGSGLKGALRHHLSSRAINGGRDDGRAREITLVFGPDGKDESRPSDHAGAAAFGDGRVLLFPVTSLAGTFAYCTSALALGRLRRDAELAGVPADWLPLEDPAAGQAFVPAPSSVVIDSGGSKVVLGDFDLAAVVREEMARIGAWIAERALPAGEGFRHFRDRVTRNFVMVNEDLFRHLVQNATVVEPHVRINDATGTADDGGFFYAEHLPPESLLWSLVGVAGARAREIEGEWRSPERVVRYLRDELNQRPVQVGAESTTGRGLVHLCFA